MFALKLLRACLLVYWSASTSVFADLPLVVDHHDPIEVDQSLSLTDLVQSTVEKYPDTGWVNALEEEADAIQRRSDSWFAGAPSVGLAYQEASSGTLHYGDATVQAPLWNFGQRDAEQNLALQTQVSAQSQTRALKLQVAGLVRAALWDLELQSVRHKQAAVEVNVTSKLFAKVQKLFELGEVARSEVLLAETELLQKRSQLTLAEAEEMHARKRYSNITRTHIIPGQFKEELVELDTIRDNHPTLQAINAQIARKQAEINTIEHIGSGQPSLSMGINTDRGDERSNKTESYNIAINIPFGGEVHLAPQIAAANVALNKLIAERELLIRALELAYHEAEHNLEINRVELLNVGKLKQIAEDHLKMTELSYSAGEISLLDLLKVQARTQQAVLSAKERSIMYQRDIALYNQAVGVMP